MMSLKKCNFCGLDFETGHGITVFGRHVKICQKKYETDLQFKAYYEHPEYFEIKNDSQPFSQVQLGHPKPVEIMKSTNILELSLVSNSHAQDNDNYLSSLNETTTIIQPNYKYTQQQSNIEARFDSMADIKINRRAGEHDKSNFLQVMPLYCAFIEQGLSIADGNKILKAFQTCIDNTPPDSKLCIPTNFKTMRFQMEKNLISDPNLKMKSSKNNLYEFRSHKWTLNDFCNISFPKKNHQNLKFRETYCLDIMQSIGDALIKIKNPKSFIRQPDNERIGVTIIDGVETESRLFTDYTSGKHFERLHEAVRNESNNQNSVALAIMMTTDETTNKALSRKGSPVVATILNVINDDSKLFLLGYLPDRLPYSSNELMVLLGKDVPQTLKKEIEKMMLREMQLSYIHFLCEPLLICQDEGVQLRVGSFEDLNSYDIHAYCHLANWSGDTKQLHALAGCSTQSKYCKCRICTEHNCTRNGRYSGTQNIRDIFSSTNAATQGKILLMERFRQFHKNDAKKNIPICIALRSITTICHQANNMFGTNPLMDIVKWQTDRDVLSFYKMFTVDMLHTWAKGLLLNCVEWSLVIIETIGKIDPFYKSALKKLDDLFNIFPLNQSLHLSNKKDYRFPDGPSSFMKKGTGSYEKKSKVGTGFTSGSLEAWQMFHIAFQLLFCINNETVPMKHDNYQGRKKPSIEWNPGEIIQNCLAVCIDFHFVMTSKVATEFQINGLDDVITNLRAHLQLLYFLKKDILVSAAPALKTKKDAFGRVIVTKRTDPKLLMFEKFYGAIKHHLIVHLPDQIKEFGKDYRNVDTERSEGFHKVAFKEPLERVSKRTDTTNYEKLRCYQISLHSKDLSSYYHNKVSGSQINDDDYSDIWTTVNFHGYDELINTKALKIYAQSSKKGSVPRRDSDAINKSLLSFKDLISIICETERYLITPGNNSALIGQKRIRSKHVPYEESNALTQQNYITSQLNPYVLDSDKDFKSLWAAFRNNEGTMRLINCVRSPYREGEEQFLVTCMWNYKINQFNKDKEKRMYVNVNNHVMIKINKDDQNEYPAEICALFSGEINSEIIDNKCKMKSIYVLFILMMKRKVTDTKCTLPYDMYGYKLNKQKCPVY